MIIAVPAETIPIAIQLLVNEITAITTATKILSNDFRFCFFFSVAIESAPINIKRFFSSGIGI